MGNSTGCESVRSASPIAGRTTSKKVFNNSGKPHVHRLMRIIPASHACELLEHRQGLKGLTIVEVPGKPAHSSAHEAMPVLLDEEPEALPPLPAPVRGDRQFALLLPPLLLLYSQQDTSACGTN